MSPGCQKYFFRYVNMSICQYVNMSEEPNILFTSEPSDQNKSCSECQQDVRNIFFRYVNMSICQYVNMSICQNATFQLGYQNESCSECHQDVRQSVTQFQSQTVTLSVS